MMRLHDAAGTGHVENTRYNGYNEIVLDAWRYQWEPELSQIVAATFVVAGSSPAARAYARLAHDSLVETLNRTAAGALAVVPPLVEYDRTNTKEPFRLIDPSTIDPMACSAIAKECWRRECEAPIFRRYVPPSPPPASSVVAPAKTDEEVVTYEQLLEAMTAVADEKKKKDTVVCADKGYS